MDGARKIPEEEAMDNSLQKIDQYTEEEAQRRFLQTIIHHTAVARAEAQGVDCCLVHLGSLGPSTCFDRFWIELLILLLL